MKETELKIRILGDPALTKTVNPVKEVNDFHRKILSQMARLMYSVSGIGLAATQVGLQESMIVVDAGSGLYKLLNPRIVKKQGEQKSEEGCLSVPGVCVQIKRAKSVVIEAIDENGKAQKIDAEGLLACVFQHELDHLNGKLIVDYLSKEKKANVKKKISGAPGSLPQAEFREGIEF